MSRSTTLFGTCLLALLGTATSASAATLIVQVRSSAAPGSEAASASVACDREWNSAYDADAIADSPRGGVTLDGTMNLVAGVRIAELPIVGFVDYGLFQEVFNYRCVLALHDAAGNAFVERAVAVSFSELNNVKVVTALLEPPPSSNFTQAVSLADDRDGDGMISVGDVLHYDVQVSGSGNAVYRNRPRDNELLIPGSVTASAGVIELGNGPGDDRVRVRNIPLSVSNQSLGFDVLVEPTLVNQGRLKVKVQGSFATRLSDDPQTPQVGDANILPIFNGGDFWRAEYDDIVELLQGVTVENLSLKQQLAGLTSDFDLDGVIAAADACPGTAANEGADGFGCSKVQFCTNIDLSDPQLGPALCDTADWGNDQPFTTQPGDCFFDWASSQCLPGQGGQ